MTSSTNNSGSKKKSARITERPKKLYLLSGLSGSGKSTVLNALDDIGYHCIDKLPVELLAGFLDFWSKTEESFAIQVPFFDHDSKKKVLDLVSQVGKKTSEKIEVLFFDSSDEVLLRRYKETRRPHPFGSHYPNEQLIDLVRRERTLLADIRGMADHVIDTSSLSPHDLRHAIEELEGQDQETKVTIQSFGFKFGADTDLDLLIDVRFLPNPHFVPELKPKTGLTEEVSTYVLNSEDSGEMLAKFEDLLKFLLPRYIAEGKRYLKIGVGCTGGKHRSVAIAEELAKRLGEGVSCSHRDLERYT